MDFKINTRNSPEEVVLAWGPTPSPITVLFNVSTQITDRLIRIQEPVQKIMKHPEIDTDSLLDSSGELTFRWMIYFIDHKTETIKRIAKTGLAYRQAFLDGKVKFTPSDE